MPYTASTPPPPGDPMVGVLTPTPLCTLLRTHLVVVNDNDDCYCVII